MNLSRHFTLEEMVHSNTAKAGGIDNTPGPAATESLRALCNAVLDPLRDAAGRPIKVNSGYRGPALNKRLGGVTTSQHLSGQAADLQAPGMAVIDLFKLAIRLALPFDQIIYEVNGASRWVHISHAAGTNSGQILLAKFDAGGKARYEAITAQQALEAIEPAPVTRSRGPVGEPAYVETADEPPRAAELAAKPPVRRKPAARKVVTKKAAATGTTAKRSTAKKTTAKKASARQPALKKAAPARRAR